MRIADTAYHATMRVMRPLLRLAAPTNPKLRRAVTGWDHAARRLVSWSERERDPARPLVWLHAPSVGEALMAQAILAELRAHRPRTQTMFTHFSPSAESVAARVGADAHAYLPWDTRHDMVRVLEVLRPDVLAFVRTEVWPVLAREARARGARVALVNAALAPDSSRLNALSRRFLAPVYSRLDAIGAIDGEDAARFLRLDVPAERVRVTGDARFDQVWASISGQHRHREARVEAAPFTIVAGSTWPADEERLVPAIGRLGEDTPVRLIIAPHEPTEKHLAGLERRLDDAGLRHARLGRLERAWDTGEPEESAAARLRAAGATLPEVVLVDRVGVLAELYAAGDAAYVGGGFGTAGLHSVIEPAARGVPVVYGPNHGNAREASRLEARGGGFVVRDGNALFERLSALASDTRLRSGAGAAALEFVRGSLGGASRNAALLGAWVEAA